MDITAIEKAAAVAIAKGIKDKLPDGMTETLAAEFIGVLGGLLTEVAAEMKAVPAAVGATVVS